MPEHLDSYCWERIATWSDLKISDIGVCCHIENDDITFDSAH